MSRIHGRCYPLGIALAFSVYPRRHSVNARVYPGLGSFSGFPFNVSCAGTSVRLPRQLVLFAFGLVQRQDRRHALLPLGLTHSG